MQARQAVHADIDGVVDTLAGAFYADPVWGWAFADQDRRIAQQSAWFRLLVRSAVAYGSVWTMPAYEAVAVWVPPGCAELTEADEAQLEPTIRETTGSRAPLLMEVFDRFEAARPHAEDHFYLSLLGTHPQHRGHGIGMRLLAQNLARIDEEGAAAYLESTNPANLRRYEGVGFAVLGSFELPANGPPVTTMWRARRA